LREMGLIETRYRKIIIRDVVGLRLAAGLRAGPERQSERQ
jgi:hypothetical protein